MDCHYHLKKKIAEIRNVKKRFVWSDGLSIDTPYLCMFTQNFNLDVFISTFGSNKPRQTKEYTGGKGTLREVGGGRSV